MRRIVAEGIDGASEHIHEFARESQTIDETHIHIGPVDIVVEDPVQTVNCFIRHNPADVLVTACTSLKEFVLEGSWNGEVQAVDRYLDCDVWLKEAEAAELLTYEFAKAAFILQYVAKRLDRPIGHLRFHVENVTLHKENFDQFFWCVEDRWDLGLMNFPLNLIQQPNEVFEMELVLALSEKRGMGIQTPFVRKLLLPMLHLLDHLEEKNIEGACYQAKSLPANLDWAEAQKKWMSENFREMSDVNTETKSL